MRFAVSYRSQQFVQHGAAALTFLVEAADAETAEAAAAELYTAAYGRRPSEDLAELVSVRIVV